MNIDNIILKSNATNFKIAIKEHILEEFPGSNVATEETEFDSSELILKMSYL